MEISKSNHSSADASVERRSSRGSGIKKGNSVRESMSGMFRNARMSFVRSRGDRGASVEQLRGTTGADFEGEAKIHRSVEGSCCGCLFFNRDPLVDRYVIVKGPFCFVFLTERAPSPQYAIKLYGLVADKPHSSHHGHAWSVVLRAGSLGDAQYELSFATQVAAQQFADTCMTQASAAATEETRKRLGHEHLLHKQASVRYAETVAQAKEKNQPEKPISRDEILNNMGDLSAAVGPPM